MKLKRHVEKLKICRKNETKLTLKILEGIRVTDVMNRPNRKKMTRKGLFGQQCGCPDKLYKANCE